MNVYVKRISLFQLCNLTGDEDDPGVGVEIAGGQDPGQGQRGPGDRGHDQDREDQGQRGRELGPDLDHAGTEGRAQGQDPAGQDQRRGK